MPATAPAQLPATPAQPATEPSVTRLAETDLPVIDPLRAPLAVTQGSANPATAETNSLDLPVLEMTDATAEVEEPQKAPVQPAAAPAKSPVVAEDKPAVQPAPAAQSLASVDNPVGTDQELAQSTPESGEPDAVENGLPVVVLAEPAAAIAPVTEVAKLEPPAEPVADTSQSAEPAQLAQSSGNSSDLELMCTEIDASMALGSGACAILDGSAEGVGFLADSAELTDNAKTVLDAVAEIMLEKQNLRLSVSTNSMDLDDTALGKLLSRRRTLAVIRHLTNSGVEGVRVRPNTRPLDTSTPAGSELTQYLVVLRTIGQ